VRGQPGTANPAEFGIGSGLPFLRFSAFGKNFSGPHFLFPHLIESFQKGNGLFFVLLPQFVKIVLGELSHFEIEFDFLNCFVNIVLLLKEITRPMIDVDAIEDLFFAPRPHKRHDDED